MSLFAAPRVLIKKGHLKPLEQRPLPDPLPSKHNPAKYCAFYQQHGHDTNQCFRLRHKIQYLLDNKVITPPKKPNITTNPLPHNQVPSPRHINLIHTLAVLYDPSIYITPSHLPKPALFISESADLCMMSTSLLQPEPVAVIVKDKRRSTLVENVSPLPEGSKDLSDVVYNLSCYIVPINQAKPEVVLPTGMEVSVVREDGPSQGLDDLADLEEDRDNLQFFDEQHQGDVHIDWFDLNGSIDNFGWLSDEPDIDEGTGSKLEEQKVRTTAMARTADEKGKLSKNTGEEQLTRELGIVSIIHKE